MIKAKQNDVLYLAWQAFEGERREGMTHVNLKNAMYVHAFYKLYFL